MGQAEALRECRASLEASRRCESATVSELARRNAEEARRVEQVRALLAASASASAPHSCNNDSNNSNKDESPAGGEGNSNNNSNSGSVVRGRMGMRTEGETGGSSVAATALSELAALEEAIAERAREVSSLKVWCDESNIVLLGRKWLYLLSPTRATGGVCACFS